jgi:hypothetical protein
VLCGRLEPLPLEGVETGAEAQERREFFYVVNSKLYVASPPFADLAVQNLRKMQ